MAGYTDNKNTFYIGEFDGDMEQSLSLPIITAVKQQSKVTNGHLDLYINSYGGNVNILNHMLEMVEVAKSSGVIVRTMVTSAAYSAGSMLAVAGSPGHRYIAKGAQHLVHYGRIGASSSTPLQLERAQAQQDLFFKSCVAHYNRHSDIPNLSDNLVDDQWYISATQAKKWGMADHFLDKFTLSL